MSIPYEQLFFLFAKALIVTMFVVLCLKSASFQLGLVDYPGGRKKHKKVVPLIGGLAIFIAVSVLLLPFILHNNVYVTFWLMCFALVIISTVDDLYGLNASHRLIMQFLLTCMVVVFGNTVVLHLGNLLGFGDISLGSMSLLFTGFAMVGIANSVNMMDGVDGLTGCVSLVEFGCLLFLTTHCGARIETVIIVIMMGAILAFLCFNFPIKCLEKRKIFLGDAGSLLIGFMLAWLCVRITQDPVVGHYPPVLMLWIVALPLMDAIHLMINRTIRGVSPFRGDRRHIHHLLLQLNYSPRDTVLMLTALAIVIAVSGICLYRIGTPEWLLFVGMFLLFCAYSMLSYTLKKRVSRRQYKYSIPFFRTEMQN
ncbi:MAG: MraY family glycosyltransferase [Legionellaceae bacterium]|nr:MraY family glycosyltransferase [Legionellaceae bacterium]